MARHVADIMLYGRVEVEATNAAEARSILERLMGIARSSNGEPLELLLSHPMRSEAPLVVTEADPSIGMIGTRPGMTNQPLPVCHSA